MTILGLGAGNNPDPRVDETVDLYAEADHRVDLNDDWELPDNYATGIVSRHSVEHLDDVYHFFREAGRVLQPQGWLEVTVPLGRDARADPDHANWYPDAGWTWWTPRMFCREYREQAGRGWNEQVPFELVSRDLNVWLLPPLHHASSLFCRLAQHWPEWGVEHCDAGGLTASYRRIDA
ncbi:methyltransferase domain-containing protein [Halomicrococcus sp. NG-SE-24]|uniref:methyltransferase domain-containing protein n=1 Tax=Halomicrococcus sp. NG-SE-24 TaxID=3436928 RepID=UPI003D9643FE